MTASRAIIFDSDGTLLDTREFIYQAYEHTLAHHGYPVPSREEMNEHLGKTLTNTYLALAPGGDLEILGETHHVFQMSKKELVAAYEGLHDVLETLRRGGFKIGICTSRGKHVEDLLAHVGVREYIDAIVSRDDVQNHKPHPEPVELVLQRLGVTPERAVMVGDTPADMGAGIAAGVKYVIGVSHGFGSREMLLSAGADHVVDHLSAIIPLVEAL